MADTTPPTTPVVTDDGAYTTSTTELHATWTSSDPESGIAEYQYQVRQNTATGPIAKAWTSTGTTPEVTATGFVTVVGKSKINGLASGKIYFFEVKARNGDNLWSAMGVSDGITVDATPPPAPTAPDEEEGTGDIDFDGNGSFSVTWTAPTDGESGIAVYELQERIGAGGAWTTLSSTLTTPSFAVTGRLNGNQYFYQVRAQNGAGVWGNFSTASDGVLIDTSAPSTVAVTDDGATTTSQTQLHAAWTASTDAQSGIAEYQYQIRQTSTSGAIIRDWTSVGTATEVTATDLTLTLGQSYFFLVRARNGAGLFSSNSASNGILIADYTGVSGTINTNTTWALAQSPFVVTGTVTVNGGATLTIQPGVTVRFNANTGLTLGSGTTSLGTLVAQGTSLQPITFTSNVNPVAPGQWNGLNFAYTTTASLMSDAVVEYGGAGTNNANIRIISSTPTLQQCTLRYSDGYGLYVTGTGVKPSITSNTFTNNGGFPLHFEFANPPSALIGNTYTANGTQAVEVVGGALRSDLTLPNEGVPYQFTASASVYGLTAGAPATLTLDAGAALKFPLNAGLTFGSGTNSGVLAAQGTVAEPVLFTSASASPAAGQWNGVSLQVTTPATVLDYTILEYGGAGTNNANLRISSSTPTIRNSTIRFSDGVGISTTTSAPVLEDNTLADNGTLGLSLGTGITGQPGATVRNNAFLRNGSYPAHLELPYFPADFTGNTFTDNGITAIELAGGTLNNARYLPATDLPYRLVANATVAGPSGGAVAVLTLAPGVTLQFAATTGLTISGSASASGALIAQGTEVQPIVFTSANAAPAPGQWNGLVFNDSKMRSRLEHCLVEYGGVGTNDANITVNSGKIFFSHGTVRASDGAGIRLNNAHASFEHNAVTGNATGVLMLAANGLERLAHNDLTGNSLAALTNSDAGDGVLAAFNWWGDAGGPGGGGPGSGAAANGLVIVEPWLMQLPTSAVYWTAGVHNPDPVTTQAGGVSTFTATINLAADWTIDILDAAQAVVRTFSGSGAAIQQDWDGTDGTATVLPNGSYNYRWSAVDPATSQPAAQAAGVLTLDSTLPIARITAPAPGAFVNGTVNIVGSAGGPGFASYKVERGVGVSPTTWTVIQNTTTTPVSDGVLATWDTIALTAPVYTVRLSVTGAGGAVARAAVTVSLLGFTAIGDSLDFLSPNADGTQETTTLSASANRLVDWLLAITNEMGQVVRTYTGTGASITQVWDARDEAGLVVPDGVYTYQFEGTDPDTGATASSTIGQVTVDTVPPQADIAVPLEGATILTAVPLSFTGTAADLHFNNYQLSHQRNGAASPTTFKNSIASVTDNLLGILSGIDALTPETYTIRLTVNDKAGNQSLVARLLMLDHLTLQPVSASPAAIDPHLSQTTAISFTLNRPADVTIRLYDEPTRQLVRTLLLPGLSAGAQSGLWDGRDEQAAVAPVDTAYYFTLEAADAAGRGGFFNDAASPILDSAPLISNATVDATNFDPFQSDQVQVDYDLNRAGKIRVAVRASPGGTILRELVDFAPQTAGHWTLFWDGLRADGRVYQGTFDVYFDVPQALPKYAVILQHATMAIEAFRIEPYLIQPNLAEVATIQYTLSQPAAVTVTVSDPAGNLVRMLLTAAAQEAGAQAVEWDGRNDAGLLVAGEGDYRVLVTAEETGSGVQAARSGTVMVYTR